MLPELAVLRFGVYDDSDKLLGQVKLYYFKKYNWFQRILPFNDLQMGYRHIALKTDANFPMALPMLFIQIDVKVALSLNNGDYLCMFSGVCS